MDKLAKPCLWASLVADLPLWCPGSPSPLPGWWRAHTRQFAQ